MLPSESHGALSEFGSDLKNELLSLPMLSKPDTKPSGEGIVCLNFVFISCFFPQSLNPYNLLLLSDVSEVSSVRKKRVRFGAPLSPEFFDKTLPPSTPLQKGATPMCPPSSTGKKRSLLKTPQRFEPPLPQPDFNSPQSNGASPVFVIDRRKTGLVYSDDVFEKVWLLPKSDFRLILWLSFFLEWLVVTINFVSSVLLLIHKSKLLFLCISSDQFPQYGWRVSIKQAFWELQRLVGLLNYYLI